MCVFATATGVLCHKPFTWISKRKSAFAPTISLTRKAKSFQLITTQTQTYICGVSFQLRLGVIAEVDCTNSFICVAVERKCDGFELRKLLTEN